MKILLSVPGLSGYGVDYLSTIARELKNKGHSITSVQFTNYPTVDDLDVKTAWTIRSIDMYIHQNVWDGYPWISSYGRWGFNLLLYKRWRRITAKELRRGDYDVVISTRVCTTPGTLAAIDEEVPSVALTTGPATVKYDSDATSLDKTPLVSQLPIGSKMQFPMIKSIHRWNTSAFQNASEVVAVSRFDASITEETFGRSPEIIRLPVPLDQFESEEHNPEKITLINPRDRHKGLDIFLDIAKELSDTPFQIAGSLYDRSIENEIESLDNVTYLGWCDDMKAVYSNTKLLLIPSSYQEGGNRIIAEAFANGIPVIGSDIGGIPDYIGGGGMAIENYTEVSEWSSAVQTLLEDEELYSKYSNQAKERAKLFSLEERVMEFEKVLESITRNA